MKSSSTGGCALIVISWLSTYKCSRVLSECINKKAFWKGPRNKYSRALTRTKETWY